jgi:hypothetical protein
MDDQHTSSGARRCSFAKEDGERCRAIAIKDSDPLLCFWHNPATAYAAQAARRRGGANANRSPLCLPPGSPDLPLESLDDAVAFLAKVANEVRRGDLDVKIGNCIGVLAAGIVRAIEVRDQAKVAEKLERLEVAERMLSGRITLLNGPRLPLPGHAGGE